MNQEKIIFHEEIANQESENQSDNSDDFQQLKTPQNESTKINKKQTWDMIEQEKPQNNQLDTILKKCKENEELINLLLNKTKQQEIQIQGLQKMNKEINQLYKNSLSQIQVLKKQNQQYKVEKLKLKQNIQQLNQDIECYKQQMKEYLQKIDLLQKNLQLSKTDFDNKFSVIKMIIQKFTKTSIKNIDNQSTFNLLTAKLKQIQKMLQRIYQIQDMIIDKNQKQKNTETFDLFQLKIKSLQKFQNVLIKQQNKINALKDQVTKLQEQLKNIQGKQKAGVGNIGKWLDPVIKFCKIEEQKEKQIKKKKDNV